MRHIEQFLDQHSARFVGELEDFLRIPSISADASHRSDMSAGAEFVRQALARTGLNASLVETEGHPIVFASWEQAPERPTVLVYGHYDVQPPDPLDAWTTPPFEPDIRDGCIYARGATDDKGQLWTHIKSVEAWMETEGRLPVNVKFVIEGEEEVGSDHLDRFLTDQREQAQCDVAVISDSSQFAPDLPAITYGLRGIMACEVKLIGPNQDLHSGVFGGSIANPANVLAQLIGLLHDDQGHVQIPGFYDDVVPLDDDERQRLASLPFDEPAFFRDLGMDTGWGEAGYSTLERRWARPTCDVNGLISGYTGDGPKTIVPSSASAKLSCRLVPNQDPDRLISALQEFVEARMPPGLTAEFTRHHGCSAIVFDCDSSYMQAGKIAIEQAFGTAPVMIREGGSIPVVSTFQNVLGADTLLLGWGQNSDNLHSPNEHFRLADFHRGIRASAHLWNELAKVSSS